MTKSSFLPLFFRSFFLQAHWNYPRMQGTGFFFVMLPLAKRLFPDRDQAISFLQRHSGHFNAQPYCASLALGQAWKHEEELAENPDRSAEIASQILRDKESLCGPLGLLGDQLFWQLWKPEAAALGILTSLLWGAHSLTALVSGALVFLWAFNSLHLWMRWWGLRTGYAAADRINSRLAQSALPKLRRLLAAQGPFLALLLGVVALLITRRQMGNIAVGSFILAFAVMYFCLKKRLGLHVALLGVALVCLLLVVFVSLFR